MAEHICARAAMLEQGLWEKTLTEAQLAELREHAQSCPECAKVLAGVAQARRGLQAWRDEAMSAPSAAAAWDKVKKQLPTPKQERGGQLMKIAAMVALVLTAGAVTFMQVMPDAVRDDLTLSQGGMFTNAVDREASDDARAGLSAMLHGGSEMLVAMAPAAGDRDAGEAGKNEAVMAYQRREQRMHATGAAPSVAREHHPGVPDIDLPVPEPEEPETDELVPYAQQRLQQEASISMRVADAAQAHKRVIELMAAAGGMLVSSQLSSEGDNGAASRLTLRIPAAKFDAFVAEVHQLGEVEAESIGVQDRTREEQRLKREVEQRTQRVEELQQQVQQEQNDRRRQLLERQLQRAQRQQAQAQRAQQQLTQAIDYATLHLTLRQDGRDAEGFGALMQEAWRVAQKHFGKGLAVIVIGVVSCLPWAALAALCWYAISRRRRNW